MSDKSRTDMDSLWCESCSDLAGFYKVNLKYLNVNYSWAIPDNNEPPLWRTSEFHTFLKFDLEFHIFFIEGVMEFQTKKYNKKNFLYKEGVHNYLEYP